MHHRQRRGVEEADGEVAIGRGVDAVRHDSGKAEIAGDHLDVDRVTGSCNRPGAQCQRIGFRARPCEALRVASERRNVPQEKMGDEHGLRRPQMREGRHHRLAGVSRLHRQGTYHAGDTGLELRDTAA